MDLGLDGRVCLVTGSTTGIGKATARMLATEGALVAVSGRSQATVDTAVVDTRAALGVARDLTNPRGALELVALVEARFGRLDCLVNCVAAAAESAAFDELTDEQWQSHWEHNVLSYVRMIRAVLPGMRSRRFGRIVNLSSSAGKRPTPSGTHYSVTKAAILSLSRAIADSYAADGILCNAVAPGPTRTESWIGAHGLASKIAAESGSTRSEVLAAVAGRTPLGRMAEVDEIAAVIVFLCSDRATYVTGSSWSVDGGAVQIII